MAKAVLMLTIYFDIFFIAAFSWCAGSYGQQGRHGLMAMYLVLTLMFAITVIGKFADIVL